MTDTFSFLDSDSLKQPKILIVEDCKFDTTFVTGILKRHFTYAIVDHAETLLDARSLLTQNRYDVVLLDLNLPDSVSFEDIDRIKSLAGKTPVVIVTGVNDSYIARKVKPFGPDGIIGKDLLLNGDFPTVMREAIDNIQNV